MKRRDVPAPLDADRGLDRRKTRAAEIFSGTCSLQLMASEGIRLANRGRHPARPREAVKYCGRFVLSNPSHLCRRIHLRRVCLGLPALKRGQRGTGEKYGQGADRVFPSHRQILDS
jgi:hypothetical protein